MEEWVREKAMLLSEEFKHYRSLDSYLVKLSSLAYDVEDYAFGDTAKAKTIYEQVLKHPLLADYISNLSCYRDDVESRISSDPRLRKLRDYSDVLLKVLSSTPCREVREIREVSRDATFRIEGVVEKSKREEISMKHRQVKAPNIVFWIGLVLLLIGVMFILKKLIH
jgi:hypothetical protein